MSTFKDKIKNLIKEGGDVIKTKFEHDISLQPSANEWIRPKTLPEPIIVELVNDEIFNKWFKKVEITLRTNDYTNEIVDPHRFETNLDLTKRQLANLNAILDILSDDTPCINSAFMWTYLIDNIISLYNNKHYSEAVFEAFKYVEDQARKKSGLEELYGVDLIRKSFAVEDDQRGRKAGPLTNINLPISEQKAQSDLFSGAIGFIKNPKSHNMIEVQKEKSTELLFFANYLLRILNGDYSKRI